MLDSRGFKYALDERPSLIGRGVEEGLASPGAPLQQEQRVLAEALVRAGGRLKLGVRLHSLAVEFRLEGVVVLRGQPANQAVSVGRAELLVERHPPPLQARAVLASLSMRLSLGHDQRVTQRLHEALVHAEVREALRELVRDRVL